MIAFALGVFLCVISWLMVTVAGFRHHAITGFVSAIPVLNLLVLPTIWHRAYIWFFTGIIGVILLAGSWIGGFDKHSYSVAKDLGIDVSILGIKPPKNDLINQSLNLPDPSKDNSTIVLNNEDAQPVMPATAKELPSNALYRMQFQTIEVAQANQYLNQYIRIVRKDRKRMEGKLQNVSNYALKIERNINGGLVGRDIQLTDIQSLEVLIPTRQQENN